MWAMPPAPKGWLGGPVELVNHYLVADRLSPVTFVKKIDVPTFMACQWTDEQTGGHCPDLAEHFSAAEQNDKAALYAQRGANVLRRGDAAGGPAGAAPAPVRAKPSQEDDHPEGDQRHPYHPVPPLHRQNPYS